MYIWFFYTNETNMNSLNKTLPYLCALLIMVQMHTFGQHWTLLNPKPTDMDLHGCFYANNTTLFVGGHYSTLLTSEDLGNTWHSPDSIPCGHFITQLHFFNADTGIALASSNILLTEDGGLTWHVTATFIPESYFDLFFLNDTLGWVCGNHSAIARTIDGGFSWEEIFTTGTTYDLYKIRFVDPDTGYACGSYGSEGLLRKTVDGGFTWTDIEVPECTETLSAIRPMEGIPGPRFRSSNLYSTPLFSAICHGLIRIME
jgi:photosystem II stability/assembly factor-like uncharacterized protein